jgi:hypothetical protein
MAAAPLSATMNRGLSPFFSKSPSFSAALRLAIGKLVEGRAIEISVGGV